MTTGLTIHFAMKISPRLHKHPTPFPRVPRRVNQGRVSATHHNFPFASDTDASACDAIASRRISSFAIPPRSTWRETMKEGEREEAEEGEGPDEHAQRCKLSRHQLFARVLRGPCPCHPPRYLLPFPLPPPEPPPARRPKTHVSFPTPPCTMALADGH